MIQAFFKLYKYFEFFAHHYLRSCACLCIGVDYAQTMPFQKLSSSVIGWYFLHLQKLVEFKKDFDSEFFVCVEFQEFRKNDEQFSYFQTIFEQFWDFISWAGSVFDQFANNWPCQNTIYTNSFPRMDEKKKSIDLCKLHTVYIFSFLIFPVITSWFPTFHLFWFVKGRIHALKKHTHLSRTERSRMNRSFLLLFISGNFSRVESAKAFFNLQTFIRHP